MNQLTVRSPYTGEVVDTLPMDDLVSLEAKLVIGYDIARSQQQRMSIPERVEVLERVAQLMGNRRSELGLLIAKEGGKPR